MKSRAGKMGNVNMRGKKTMVLRCGCCDAIDLRDKERRKEAAEEMAQARRQIPGMTD